VRRNRLPRVDAETEKAARERGFSPNTARFTASRPGDIVAHGEKGGLNFLFSLFSLFSPYGWLEGYDLAWTPNTTDAEGRRYCYGNQPHIAHWNLARLADALLQLGIEKEKLQAGLELYADTFSEAWSKAVAHKLGVESLDQPGDDELVKGLFALMSATETDFTIFFRNLATPTVESLLPAYYGKEIPREQLEAWLKDYVARCGNAAGRLERMNAANPKYVFRNYLAQQAIDAVNDGDTGPLDRLMRVLKKPYDEQPAESELAARRPEWARHKAGCSAFSCSS
jgi:uncharacterized protein YdiU (UPF0061 family)